MINTIAELIKQLDIYFKSGNENTKIKCLIPLIESYCGVDWKHNISYDYYNYKRNLIYRNYNYELYIICWLPKHQSKLHFHPKNGCIFKILSGIMTELRYLNTKETIFLKHEKDKTEYIDNDIGKHIVANTEKRIPLVSLHLYSPPIRRKK